MTLNNNFRHYQYKLLPDLIPKMEGFPKTQTQLAQENERVGGGFCGGRHPVSATMVRSEHGTPELKVG